MFLYRMTLKMKLHKNVFKERDYTKIYDKFLTLGEGVAKNGLGAHGNHYKCADVYEEMLQNKEHVIRLADGKEYPSLKADVEAIDAILKLSTLTNGKLTKRAYENMASAIGNEEIAKL